MRRPTLLMTLLLVAAACSSEPGGGGVNLAEPTTTSQSVVQGSTTTFAPTTTSTTTPATVVEGRVRRPGGGPVAGALVTMGDLSIETEADGSFTFETHQPGDMTVTKLGWSTGEIAWDETSARNRVTIRLETVRGLRVSADAAGDDAEFGSLLELAEQTAVNAFVFDTKQEGGLVLYETEVTDAHDAEAVRVVYDPAERIEQAHADGIYAITRIVTFEDDLRVRAFPAEKLAGAWLDPTSRSARDYNLALAVEACEIGFDEIQFDYVRYPAGKTAAISGQRDLSEAQRVGHISSFLAEARALLEPMGCSVSAAIFGIVASTPNDQGLGQRPEELSAELDAVSPMVYPSHYSPGWLGFDDPNDHPYDVTADALSDALPRMADGSQLRPWLQAFWWSNDQIRRSIDAAEDLGTGWILWNIRSNFDRSALPTDEEVGS